MRRVHVTCNEDKCIIQFDGSYESLEVQIAEKFDLKLHSIKTIQIWSEEFEDWVNAEDDVNWKLVKKVNVILKKQQQKIVVVKQVKEKGTRSTVEYEIISDERAGTSYEDITSVIDQTTISSSRSPSSSADSPNISLQPNPFHPQINLALPGFSLIVQPLLMGEEMTPENRKRLSAQLKEEIVNYLNEHHLIENESPANKRWLYNAFGKMIADSYPNMLWDEPNYTGKAHQRRKKKPAAWTPFMHNISQRRKQQFLRKKIFEPNKDMHRNESEIPTDCSAKRVKSEIKVIERTRICDETFSLPPFSLAVQPLLMGEEMSPEHRKKLSSQLKDEIVIYMNKNNLIQCGTSGQKRWMYNAFGKTLADTYPNMLWDEPNYSGKAHQKRKKIPAVWVPFMHHISQRRKQQFLKRLKRLSNEANNMEHDSDFTPFEAEVNMEVEEEALQFCSFSP